MEEKQYYVLLASKKYGTLYTGVTSNLVQRIWQHKEGLAEGFTKKYHVHHLVYYEIHSDVYEAITREKRIKKWNRQWKINLIEQNNPSGLIWVSGYFDEWLPACAGMTDFFVMSREVLIQNIQFKSLCC